MPPVTRFAPSPTGYLHLGHVVNAIYVWGLARAAGGRVLLRIEDHDRIRSRPKFEAAILDDLSWLGFVPDEGLVPLRRQSDNGIAYARALATLVAVHDVYACDCSRTQIARVRRLAASAGQGADWYPGTCRHRRLQPGDDVPLGVGIRVQLDDAQERFVDGAVGEVLQAPAEQCGDLLLKDRDGNWTYQFAVTVDDIDDGVDLVVRGLDLLSSTGRQIKLARMLGRANPPHFFHHPLIVKPDGEKLSKASGDTGVRELRKGGADPATVIGLAAAAIGLVERGAGVTADAVAGLFADSARGR
jgi:glutamyl-tRNA synthetase/glutamyl-Q tRNA(Asp) synthetase